ncbi:MAG: hypothetical protein ACNYNX_01880 [Leucobacter sp.]
MVMYGIAGLLLGACVVQFIAPDGATVEMPTPRYGREQTEVGLWALHFPRALALLAASYATTRLLRVRPGKRRIWLIMLLATGSAVLFTIIAYDALT